MKKVLLFVFAALMVLSCVACGGENTPPAEDINAKSEGVMTWEEYNAAAIDASVVVEAYVQAKQGYWEKNGQGLCTIYAQDGVGGYFIYDMPVTKADYDKMVAGTKIKVTGKKAEWSGEVEIIDATYAILDGSYVAPAKDVTALLGTDDLAKSQNMFASFKGMTVEASKDADGNDVAFLYKWNGAGEEGDDLYFNVSVNGKTYTFCVESYLCGADTDVYKAVKALKIGDKIDLEGFLYWYEGVQPHVTSVTAAK